MMIKTKLSFFMIFILLCIWFNLNSSKVARDSDNNEKLKRISQKQDHQRILPHLITDKPIYKPGDTINYKILNINPFKRFLVDSNNYKTIHLKDSKGKIIYTTNIYPNHGEYQLSKEINGGQYSLEVKLNGFQAFSNFSIESFSNPKIMIDLIFQSNGYSPKDTVKVISLIKRADGSIPESSDLEFSVLLDGREIKSESMLLEKKDEGKKSFSFDVPEILSKESSMLLSLKVIEGGVVEQKSKTVPLILKEDDVEVKFYPEGGNIIYGSENTVYFEALSKSGDPVDVQLEVLTTNQKNQKFSKRVESKHEGRGSFTLVPELNDQITVNLLRPSTLQTFTLPKIEKEGVLVNFQKTILETESPVVFTVSNLSPKTKNFKVCVFQKEKELSSRIVSLSSLEHVPIELSLPSNVVGVLRFTVYEIHVEDNKKILLPQYERLIFRKPKQNIFLSIQCQSHEGEFFSINSDVNCNVTSKDENGQPVSVFLIVDVVDETVLSLIEKRKRRLQISEKVLLGDEFSHVEDSGSYFNDENFASQTNLDLLMGIQGWRRFCYENITQVSDKFGSKADRLFAAPSQNEEFDNFEVMREREMMAGEGMAPNMFVGRVQKKNARGFFQRSVQKMASVAIPAPKEKKETYQNNNKKEIKVHHRTNFVETLYSKYGLITDKKNGIASFSFKTSDSITSYRFLIEGIVHEPTSLNEENGFNMASHFSNLISCRNKFFVEPKLPSFVLEGDTLHLPITYVYNNQRKIQVETEIKTPNEISPQNPSQIYPFGMDQNNQRTRKVLPLKINEIEGRKDLNVTISAVASSSTGDFLIGDTVTRPFVATHKGINQNIFHSGLLSSKSDLSFSIKIPQKTFQLSTSNSKVFGKPTSTLLSAIDTLITEPYGCFEQTSATLFPMIMALNYMKTKNIQNESLFEKAQKHLKSGYERLASYEVKQTGGFEWFGRNPSSESLTAYGIFELEEMRKVFDGVDPKLISRAKTFLENRKKEDGFLQSSVALDTFGRAPEKLTDAYIVWSLIKSNINSTSLSSQINDLKKQVFSVSKWENDPYLLALVSDILFKVGQKEDSFTIAKRLLSFIDKDGSVDKSFTTITCSCGVSKTIETTSLSILAWLNFPTKFQNEIHQSISFLLSKCNGAKFGSTQGTILALYALIEYDLKFPSSESKATIKMVVNKDTRNEISIEYDPSSYNPIKFPPFHHLLKENSENTFDLSIMTEKEKEVSVPFTIDINYKTEYPLSHPQSPFNLNVDFINPLGNSFDEGKSYQIKVSLENKWDKDLGMVIVKIGIPGGFAIRFEKLKELVASRKIAHYETKENSIIFYFDFMSPNQHLDFMFDVDAFAPGSYRSSPSVAYLYYGDEYKTYLPFVLIADIKAIQ